MDRSGISISLIRYALSLLGTSTWSARFIPSFLGAITGLFLFFPIRKMVGPILALMAVLLLTLSPWHIYFSQNARYFSILILLSSASSLLFFLGVEENNQWYLFLSIILLSIATLEKNYALLLIPVAIAYLLLLRFLPIEKPHGLQSRNLALITIPMVAIGLFIAIDIVVQGENSLVFIQISSFMNKFMGKQNMLPQWLLTSFVNLIGYPLHLLAVIGAISVLLQKRRDGLFLVLWAWVPLVFLMLLSVISRTFTRYASISLVALFILGAIGLKELYILARNRISVAPLFTLSLFFFSIRDPLIRDVTFHLGGIEIEVSNTILDIFVISGLIIVLLGLVTYNIVNSSTNHRKGKFRGSKAKKDTWYRTMPHLPIKLWAFGILIPVLLHPIIADFLYYKFQHGYRDDWIGISSIIMGDKRQGDIVYSTHIDVARFYLGDLARYPPSDLNSLHNVGHRVWIVEDPSMEEMKKYVAWFETNCEIVGILDNYAAARNWRMRLYLCVP